MGKFTRVVCFDKNERYRSGVTVPRQKRTGNVSRDSFFCAPKRKINRNLTVSALIGLVNGAKLNRERTVVWWIDRELLIENRNILDSLWLGVVVLVFVV